MSSPYCVCAQGVYCEACHEEMCAEASNVGSADTRDEVYYGSGDEEVSDGELAERDDFEALADYVE